MVNTWPVLLFSPMEMPEEEASARAESSATDARGAIIRTCLEKRKAILTAFHHQIILSLVNEVKCFGESLPCSLALLRNSSSFSSGREVELPAREGKNVFDPGNVPMFTTNPSDFDVIGIKAPNICWPRSKTDCGNVNY